jgi:hypothetical protein
MRDLDVSRTMGVRNLLTTALCLSILLSPASSQTVTLVGTTLVAQYSAPESRNPLPDDPERAETRTSTDTLRNAVDVTCQTLGSAALLNDIPVEFFTRLIWQESRFDTRAVSRAGAQGIAQFMPGTATWVGLANPFDAAAAIAKSAELLRDLNQKFGNLGLAAAAYNAGPKRVEDWLAHRRSLPRETQTYIRIVTGHTADEWMTAVPRRSGLPLLAAVPCPDILKLFANRPPLAGQDKPKPATVSNPPGPTWGVQLVGSSSQISALASFYQLQKTYWAVLGSHEPLVIRSSAGVNAYWYRVRVGVNSRGEAARLCSSLRAVGGTCLVQPN